MKSPSTSSVGAQFLLFVLLTFFSHNILAQKGLQPNLEKAKKEFDYLDSQKRILQQQAQNEFLQKPGFSIEKQKSRYTFSFEKNYTISANNFFQKFSNELGIKTIDKFKYIQSQKDNLGYTHYRYDQYYNGIRVDGGQLILHEKGGKLDLVNGNFYNGLKITTTPAITKEKALEISRRFIMNESPSSGNDNFKKARQDGKESKSVNYAEPKLVIAPKDGKYSLENFRLTYLVNITSSLPMRDVDVYVDAQTGEVINSVSNIANADVSNTSVETLYNGTQTVTTDYTNNFYRLQESSTRPIQTFNMLNKSDYSKSVDFLSKNNKWTSTSYIYTEILILNINDNWKDALEDTKPGDADLYIELWDSQNNLLYGKDDVSSIPNVSLPTSISINNIPLLEGDYILKVYDRDFLSSDDFITSFLFTATNGTKKYVPDVKNIFALTSKLGRTGALNAHWGMEKVYDYYLNKHRRLSYDGADSPIRSYIHPNAAIFPKNNPNNAFWSPGLKGMFFGDGDGKSRGPIVSLDVCGHEMTHAFIDYNVSGGLKYENESGALNESFADIFGTAIEFSTQGVIGNWTIGEDTSLPPGNYYRSMQLPKSRNQPNTYQGTNWYTGGDDDGGVHTNSGVQNYWFYLLSNGGKGRIDDNSSNDEYDVPGITLGNAAKIAYTNMMQLLPKNATYEDAYKGALKAATMNSFSETSNAYRSVREAWYAVGVAKKPKINSFTPEKGNIGTQVTINGENFTGLSYVIFNDVKVEPSNFTVNSDGTQITVNVPSGAKTGYISLVAGYQTISSDPKKFSICDGLVVSVSSTNASSFVVSATGGIDPYQYSLDNVNFQSSNVFTGLSTGRTYTVYVKDANECIGQSTFFLSNPIQCNTQSGSGGQGTTFVTQILGTIAGSVSIDYQMYTIPDQMEVYYNDALVASTSGLVSGGGRLTFNYTPLAGGPYSCIIRMNAPNSGTAWDFIAYCPVLGARIAARPASSEISDQFRAVISPNPSSDVATLSLNGTSGETTVVLVDVMGREMWKTSRSSDGDVSIPVTKIVAGTYFITVTNSSFERKILRFIKSR